MGYIILSSIRGLVKGVGIIGVAHARHVLAQGGDVEAGRLQATGQIIRVNGTALLTTTQCRTQRMLRRHVQNEKKDTMAKKPK